MSREVVARVEGRNAQGYVYISIQPHHAGDLQKGEIVKVVIPEGAKTFGAESHNEPSLDL